VYNPYTGAYGVGHAVYGPYGSSGTAAGITRVPEPTGEQSLLKTLTVAIRMPRAITLGLEPMPQLRRAIANTVSGEVL
jgi:hypothetical protein